MESRFDEDYVEYHVYQLQPDIDVQKITEFVESKSRNYIWQKDSFSMCKEDDDTVTHMFGYCRFGDNIEDEWFIVYLLFELSKQFPSLVISVTDNDGEFLLIEAAFAIPKWLKPDNSNNRVFVQGGKLHIIPPPKTPSELSLIPPSPTTKQAVELILNKNNIQTEASSDVQEIILKRIHQYPEKAKEESTHYVACWLPVQVAWILYKCPQLVTKAVSAFYYRDLADMKVIYEMKTFTPSAFPIAVDSQISEEQHLPANGKGSVLARVRFTRCSYAQLQRQQFEPPLCFGHPPSHKHHKAWLLGAKLAAGFEILYKYSALCDQRRKVESSVSHEDSWVLFNNLLMQYDYYSSTDNTSMAQSDAEQSFLAWDLATKDVSYIDTMSATLVIHNILKTAQAHSLPVFPRIPADDGESWLEISVEHLDMLLKERGTQPKQPQAHEKESDMDQERFNLLIDRMTQFMEQKSSFEGVDTKNSDSESDDDNPITFDEATFMNRINGFGAQDQEEEDEDEEDDNDEIHDTELVNIMKQMDLELRTNPNLFNSFETEDVSEDGIKPVDLNLNMVKNLLDSYSLQQGMPGPLTNILGEMYHAKK